MNIDLTPILQAVITLLAALVTYKLIPWIKQKTTNEQQLALGISRLHHKIIDRQYGTFT